MRISGPLRLWIVVGALWSITWSFMVAWASYVDGITLSRSDYFLVPSIVLAPWLLSGFAAVCKWVIAGFRKPASSN